MRRKKLELGAGIATAILAFVSPALAQELGTLEAGKLADIVLLAGYPVEGYWNFLNPKLVIKGGIVVSDQR